MLKRFSGQLYRFVKRHRRLRELAKFLWHNLAKLNILYRRRFLGQSYISAPRDSMETADWIHEQGNRSQEGEMPSFMPLYKRQFIECSLPRTIDSSVFWKFKTRRRLELPPAFVAAIPQGRVWSEGYVVSPDNLLLRDVSRTLLHNEHTSDLTRHPIFHASELPPIEQYKGQVAVLATQAGRGYYHWMLDALPRLHLLERAGYSPAKIDRFVVNDCIANFHFSTLETCGIPSSKVLQTQWHPHIRAERLIVPSHAGGVSAIPEWACSFLTEKFQPGGRKLTAGAKVYLHRGENTHRKIINDAAVVDLMKKRGFSILNPEDFSLPEQVAIFREARVVVSPHGSALVNIVFCEPGAKVIEFFCPAAVSLMYWRLCVQRQLEYFYLFDKGDRLPEGVEPFHLAADLEIDLSELNKILDLAEA